MKWQDELKKLLLGLYGLDTQYIPELMEEVEAFITSLLKEQRKICAKIYDRDDSHYENFENILDSPEPEGVK